MGDPGTRTRATRTQLAIIAILMFVPFSARAELAWEMLNNPEFRTAYLSALGAKKTEKWLALLPGPSAPTTNVALNGTEYVLSDSCKPHWCDTHNIVFAYAPTSKKVFGKLVEDSVVTWLGSPSSDIQAMLEAKYAKRFSKQTQIDTQQGTTR